MEQPAVNELQRSVAELSSARAELRASTGRLEMGIDEQRRTAAELKDSAVRACSA